MTDLRPAGSLFLGAALAFGLAACDEELPTAEDGGLLPVSAQTVEVRIPMAEFASDVQVLGGFGTAAGLGRGLLANDADGLTARTLIRYPVIPPIASVRDAEGVLQLDSLLTFTGGEVVLRLDVINRPPEPVTITAGAVSQSWDPSSATWDLAVDTAATQEAWNEPGGGSVTPLDTVVWDPEASDSVIIRVDSATAAQWTDSTSALRGLRVSLEDPGVRFRILGSTFRAEARPSVDPDTVIVLNGNQESVTFIYDPAPAAPTSGLRVGGAPAWRSVLRFSLPDVIQEPDPACQVLSCPFELNPNSVIFASLVLETRVTEAPFAPTDTLSLQTRPVLLPERLPKSPLGDRQQLVATRLAPEAFGPDGSTEAIFTVTGFVRDILRGETEDGEPAPTTLALVSLVEPQSLGFATFAGAESEDGAPFLRILLTLADGIGLP